MMMRLVEKRILCPRTPAGREAMRDLPAAQTEEEFETWLSDRDLNTARMDIWVSRYVTPA